MSKRKPTYTPEQRAEAVALAIELGNYSAAGRRLGIPAETIRRWAAGQRAPLTLELVGQVKGEMVERLTSSMMTAHNAMMADLLAGRLTPGQTITAFGVLADKVIAWRRFAGRGDDHAGELDRIAEALEQALIGPEIA